MFVPLFWNPAGRRFSMTKIVFQTSVPGPLEQRLQLGVAANFLSKILTVGFTKRVDARSSSDDFFYQALDLLLARLRDAEFLCHIV